MNTLKPITRCSLIVVLLISIAARGQERSIVAHAPQPVVQPGTVTLSLAEFDHLTDLASRKLKTPDNAPIPFVLSSAAFDMRVGEDSVTGSVALDGDLFRKGPTKV